MTCLSGWLRCIKCDKSTIWHSHFRKLIDHDHCLTSFVCFRQTKRVPITCYVFATRMDLCAQGVVVKLVGLLYYVVLSNATMAIRSALNRALLCTVHARILLPGFMRRTLCQPLPQVYPRFNFRNNLVSNDMRQRSICCISSVQRSLHLIGKN